MTHLSRAIEAVARAIARHIPLDAGSRWNPGNGENFPLNYSDKECAAIRAIAAMAITAYEAHLKAEGLVLVDAYERKGRTVREHQENVRALVSVCERALIERNEEILRLRAMIAASQEPSNASD